MLRLDKYLAVVLAIVTVGATRCDTPECIEIAGPCGSSGGSGGGSSGRLLTVTTVTTGVDLDPDGYTVSIAEPHLPGDGFGIGSFGIGVNETKTLTSSSKRDGEHIVELIDIADNCTVAGENPRSIRIARGEETPTTIFEVSCTAISP